MGGSLTRQPIRMRLTMLYLLLTRMQNRASHDSTFDSIAQRCFTSISRSCHVVVWTTWLSHFSSVLPYSAPVVLSGEQLSWSISICSFSLLTQVHVAQAVHPVYQLPKASD